MAFTSSCVVIDPHGDLKLHVGKDEGDQTRVTFLVCSRTLARTSTVFDRMLYGCFRESSDKLKADDDWEIDLQDERPATMDIFLNITHSNFAKVPRILSVDELYELTICTNYYDTSHILGFWVDAWVSSVDEIARDANALMPKLLWIFWELGRKEELIAVADRMLLEWKGPLNIQSWHMSDLHTPLDVIDRIDTLRTTTIERLLNVFSEMVNHLTVVDEGPRWCQHASFMSHHRCESIILGSMTFCLMRAGLWPLPAAQDMAYSIQGLYAKLTNLVIHDLGEVERKPLVDHTSCNPAQLLLDRIRQVMEDIPSTLSEEQLGHLDKQAQKHYLSRNRASI